MVHTIEHLEISANDLTEAGTFYAAVFGFDVEDHLADNYTLLTIGEGEPNIALIRTSKDNPAGRVVPYFTTGDVAATLAKVTTAGGKTIMESTSIPNVGDVGMFMDPTGNVLGVWKQKNQ